MVMSNTRWARMSQVLLSCLVSLAATTSASGQTSTDDCRRQVDAALGGARPAGTVRRSQIADLKTALGNRPYQDAYRAGVELLRQPELSYGTTLSEIIGILGRPDLIWADNDGGAEVYYNTNGGPLDLSFQRCGLIHKAMDTPAHWSGTNQELAALWSKARRSREWWLWHPMTGAISRVEQNDRESEVDLEGGMFGDTGRLSFILPTNLRCRGLWSASAGHGLVVTRAELLSQYGPRYFPGYAVPAGAGSDQRLGHAFIDCDGGRTMRLEFITGPGTPHGWGIGQDDEGTIYRFTF
jgi:hypothetical protein